MAYSPRGRKGSDTTERLHFHYTRGLGLWSHTEVASQVLINPSGVQGTNFPHLLFLHKACGFIRSAKYLRIYYIRHWDAIINTSLMLQECMI